MGADHLCGRNSIDGKVRHVALQYGQHPGSFDDLFITFFIGPGHFQEAHLLRR